MKRKLPIVLSAITSCILLASCEAGKAYSIQEYIAGELQYKENFRILQLTDVHIGNKDNQKKQFDFMDLTIKDANADMIIVTGDLFTYAEKKDAKNLFNFLDSYGIPWTVTFGNHDEQCYFSIDWLTSTLNKWGSNCIFKDIQDDDVFGNANFVINLTDAGKVKQQLIVMDSNRYYFGDYFGYDYFKQDQIDWYEKMVNYTTAQNEGTVVPSLMFYHIPVPEFADAYKAYEEGKPEAVKFDADKWERNEGVACPDYNSGMFDKVLELGSTKGMFVGHDHINSWAITYKGVLMSYGITSDDRIYSKKDLMGGQVIMMDSTNKITLERYFHTYDELEGTSCY